MIFLCTLHFSPKKIYVQKRNEYSFCSVARFKKNHLFLREETQPPLISIYVDGNGSSIRIFVVLIRWITHGALLESEKKITLFLQDKAKPTPKLHDPEWVSSLAFIVNVTKHLNDLNIKLQAALEH